MRTLRLRHGLTGGGGSLIAVDYDPGHGPMGSLSEVPFLFELGDRGRTRLRFYLEDQLANLEPSGRRSVGEAALALRRWGEEIFRQMFVHQRQAAWQYVEASRDLQSLRIEIHSEHPNAWAIPWELLRDPDRGWVAPQVSGFVRRAGGAQRAPAPPTAEPVLRVLYVVCRPAGSAGNADLPFRSAARTVLLSFAEHRERVRIDILRPPTFERLAKTLSAAAEAGEPYRVLHFDGHGVLTDRPQDFAGELDPGFVRQGEKVARREWSRRRGGARGYLLFEDLDEGGRRWTFGDTPKLSTYVTVVNGGPFHELRSQRGGYDLGLYSRQSLKQFLERDAEELYDLTDRGLAFFGERFGQPFAQERYDQVFVPNMGGAMENWGSVTWTDSVLYRSTPTYGQRAVRAQILLHEMAHMWFGDLVTMKWWDDLWLNEAFASWASNWAGVNCTEFTDEWATFLAGGKMGGYRQDMSPATHPIRGDVPDVAQAMANFDAITYTKGASVLKQLMAFVGEDRAGHGGSLTPG